MNVAGIRAEYDAKNQLIFSHPGYREHRVVEGLARTLEGVVNPNLVELVQLLEAIAVSDEHAAELIRNEGDRGTRELLFREVLRRLHNYLASANSLVDHSRRIMRHRRGTTADEFAKRAKELSLTAEWCFVLDLRNYTLHRTLPFVGASVRFDRVDGATRLTKAAIELSKTDLTTWSGWRPVARHWLNSSGEQIEFLPVVKTAGEACHRLNAWLLNALSSDNEGALREVNELVTDATAVLFDGDRSAATKFMLSCERRTLP